MYANETFEYKFLIKFFGISAVENERYIPLVLYFVVFRPRRRRTLKRFNFWETYDCAYKAIQVAVAIKT